MFVGGYGMKETSYSPFGTQNTEKDIESQNIRILCLPFMHDVSAAYALISLGMCMSATRQNRQLLCELKYTLHTTLYSIIHTKLPEHNMAHGVMHFYLRELSVFEKITEPFAYALNNDKSQPSNHSIR